MDTTELKRPELRDFGVKLKEYELYAGKSDEELLGFLFLPLVVVTVLGALSIIYIATRE
jgi:hypothetical protein